MYVGHGPYDGQPKRSDWRDPFVFVVIDALIEYGLGEIPQDSIPKRQLKSAVKVYFLRHPYAVPPKHEMEENKKSPIYQATGKIGGLTRSSRLTPEQRQDIAAKGGYARWHGSALAATS